MYAILKPERRVCVSMLAPIPTAIWHATSVPGRTFGTMPYHEPDAHEIYAAAERDEVLVMYLCGNIWWETEWLLRSDDVGVDVRRPLIDSYD